MSKTAERMMALFAGYEDAHGTHGKTDKNDAKGGKLEIKKSARTLREPTTIALWEQHLSGERALGIIPIRKDSTSLWGCIDVDRYDINHGEVVKELKKRGLPLVVCTTKSGGAHAFLFLKYPEAAEDLRATLKNVAASMGWGDCEIFPKQNRILADKGDLGNWLNMPYLGGDESNRHGVRENGLAMTLDEFLTYAESKAVELHEVKFTRPIVTEKKGQSESDIPFADGPPCLQHLSILGLPDGTRNKGLFAMGVYCKKKYGETWKDKLEDMNRQYVNPPLDSEEMMGIIKNLEKSEYNYSCRDTPLCNHCESTVCRTRKFGIGGSGQYPVVSGLSKLNSEPPIWFLDIDGDRIELSTDALQNYRSFQAACMEQLTIFFMPVKHDVWSQMIGEAMQNATIIEVPPEMSIKGHFMELLEAFITDRHKGERWEDIHQGRPYFDPETELHWFRLQDFMKLLERENFKVWGRNKVGKLLGDLGTKKGKNIGGKFVNLFGVPDTLFTADPEAIIPDVPVDPI